LAFITYNCLFLFCNKNNEYNPVIFSRRSRRKYLEYASDVFDNFRYFLFSGDYAETQEMIADLKINDEVVTNGGVIGRIKEVRETSFIIQSADKSFIEIARSAVVGKRAEK
jgi:preprotein translocase YajC subunit